MGKESAIVRWLGESTAGHESTQSGPFSPVIGLPHLDDCAVIALPGEYDLVVGTDFIRGPAFDLFAQAHMLTWFDLGYFLVGANLSDIAAMGATPIGVLDVVRYDERMTEADAIDCIKGMQQACAAAGCALLGGDTGGYTVPVLSASALGYCPKGRCLLRSNGRPDDVLMLAGYTGVAGAARGYFSSRLGARGLAVEQQTHLLDAWRRPVPQLVQGQLLVREQLSRCAIDTSDGLKAAIQQIAASSHLQARIDLTSIPIDPVVKQVAHLAGVSPYDLALSDSPDFRLVFTVSRQDADRVLRTFRGNGWPLWAIGRLVTTDSVSHAGTAVTEDGGNLPGIPWDHSEIPTLDRLKENT